MVKFYKKFKNYVHEKTHAKKNKTEAPQESVFVLAPFSELKESEMGFDLIDNLCKKPKEFKLSNEPFGIYFNAQPLPTGTDFATVAPEFKKRYVAEFNISIAELTKLLSDENLRSNWSGLNVSNPKKISEASWHLNKHLIAVHCDVFNPRTESWNRGISFSKDHIDKVERKHTHFRIAAMQFVRY